MQTVVPISPEEIRPPVTDEPLQYLRLLGVDFEELLNQRALLEAQAQLVSGPELLDVDKTKEGIIRRYGFVTAAGHAYDGVVGIPKNQTTDIPIVATSAWGTSSRGHNEHAMRHAMRDGEPVMFVGAEGSYRPSEQPKDREPITLAGSAAATLSFSRVASELHPEDIDESKRLVVGDSRGAMVGMGIVALDEVFDQEVLYADLTAPCFPRKFELKDIFRMNKYIYREPQSFARMVGHLTFGQVIHYPSTLDLHPTAIRHQPAIGRALFSGEAGDMARLIDPDVIAHITCFNDDFASMKSEWESIFADHPNVQITPLDGSHLTLADPETMAYVSARVKAFHMLYEQKADRVTGTEIFALAHQLLEPVESAA